MNRVSKDHTVQKPFIDHLHELQIRLTWAVLAIVVSGVGAYMFQEQLLAIIQRPLGQTLYYTSPTGGFSFIFKMSAVTGIVVALPIILYQLFKFLGPLLGRAHKLSITAFALWSINLAYAGILFAYFFSLPAALHFLAKFGGEGIESLITADEYFNFALAYLAGFAILFQLPLVVLFINKIKPLKPGRMMSAQRYIILVSFVLAAILTPTPDPINQAIMAVPVIGLYQLSIVLVILINRAKRDKKAHRALKAERRTAVREAKVVKQPAIPLPSDLHARVNAVQSRPAAPALVHQTVVKPLVTPQRTRFDQPTRRPNPAFHSTRPLIADIVMR